MPHKQIQRLMSITLALGEAAKSDNWQEVTQLLTTRQELLDQILKNDLTPKQLDTLKDVYGAQEQILSQITGELNYQRKGEANRHAAVRKQKAFKSNSNPQGLEMTG